MNPVANDHYQGLKIQPVDFIEANNLDFNQGNIIKYVCRYKEKGGIIDLEKAKYYLERLIKNQEKEINKNLEKWQVQEDFAEQEARQDVIGQNGNDGLHYPETLISEIKAALKPLGYNWAKYATACTVSGFLTIYRDKPKHQPKHEYIFEWKGKARHINQEQLKVNLKGASIAKNLIIKL